MVKKYPATYLKSQKKPIYRTQYAAQERELFRFMLVTGLPKGESIAILTNKYKKVGMKFLDKTNKPKTR
jgi:hypothetical protein